jgi:hypothetical protein
LTGVVTLGTPFIACRSRNLDFSKRIARVVLPTLAGLAAFVATALVECMAVLLHFPEWGLLLPIILSGPLLLSAVQGARKWTKTRMNDWIRERADEAVTRLSPQSTGTVPIVCLRTTRDEAHIGLSWADRIMELPSLAWNSVVLGGAFLLGFIPSARQALLDSAPTDASDLARSVFAVVTLGLQSGIVTMSIVALLIQVVYYAVPKPLRWGAFGVDKLYDGWLVRLKHEPLPVGNWAGLIAPPPLSLPGFAHTKLHSHPIAVEHLATSVFRLFNLEPDSHSRS